MIRKNISVLLLTLIILLAFGLRVHNLESIPPSLSPDEAALGYNAYSLLQTGKDEHGQFLPLSLQSFGDWKLPVYSYLTIPFILFFGLTEFSVRILSVFAGVISTVLIYFIARKFFTQKPISFIAAFLFAISPWSIYFSHAAYEVNLGMCFFLAGFYMYLSYRDKKRIGFLFGSALFFILTFFTYHSFLLFTPLFVLLLLYSNYKKVPLKMNLLFGGLIALCLLVSYLMISQHGFNKVSTLSILNDRDVIYGRSDKLRGDGSPDNPLLARLLYNKYVGGAYQIGQNYLSAFSPAFLFDKGGEKTLHNLGYFGNLYLFDALLLAVGLSFLLYKREKALAFLLLWILISPIPSAFTKDAQNSTRLFTFMPVFILVSAYGAYTIFQLLYNKRNPLKLFALGILGLLFLFNIFFFLDGYFVHMKNQRARFWYYGYKQIAEISQQYPKYNVVFRGPDNFPYIYFLFYSKYDPNKFVKEVAYYPPTDEGFYFVKSFGRYTFPVLMDSKNIRSNTLYVDYYMASIKYPSTQKYIRLPSGEPIFIYKLTAPE